MRGVPSDPPYYPVMDRRRFLLASFVGTFATPLPVEAQPAKTVPVVGILHDRPAGPSAAIRGLQEGLRRLGYEVLRAATQAGSRALVQLGSPIIDLNARRIAELTLKQRLPAISPFRAFAAGGGLMSYGPDQTVFYPRAANYIARILKGTRPGDLPIEEPERFDLILNLTTAKTLGLTIPPSLLARADQVIE